MGHFVLEVKRVIVDPAARGLVRRLDWWPDWRRWQPRLAPGGSFFKPAANNQKQKPCTRRSARDTHRGYSPYDTAMPSSVCFEKEPEALIPRNQAGGTPGAMMASGRWREVPPSSAGRFLFLLVRRRVRTGR